MRSLVLVTLLFLNSVFSLHAQKMSFEKTVEYIEYKMKLNTASSIKTEKVISFGSDKSGNIVIVTQSEFQTTDKNGVINIPSGLSHNTYQFNLNEIERFSFNDEGSFWIVSTKKNIRHTDKMVYYDNIFLYGPHAGNYGKKERQYSSKTKTIWIVIGSELEAKRLKSAFEHLKTLTSDPFDN